MPRIPVTARNADLIFTSTPSPFKAKTFRRQCGHIFRCKKIATHPNSIAVRLSTPWDMSFRIYRLAKKEAKQGGSGWVFAQTITRPDGQGRGSRLNLARVVHSERRNSRRASFSAGFSFSNFSVT